MWVIKSSRNGMYVAPPGEDNSFTTDLAKAWTFTTPDKAQKQCCGDEMVMSVEHCLRKPE